VHTGRGSLGFRCSTLGLDGSRSAKNRQTSRPLNRRRICAVPSSKIFVVKPATKSTGANASMISSALAELVGNIPSSIEEEVSQPERRARIIAKKAAVKAAAFSGVLAIPPGPLGIATLIPDLVGIWRLQ